MKKSRPPKGPVKGIEVDEAGLRYSLEDLPCCPTSQDGRQDGDSLNLVLIGNAKNLMPAFVRRGWHMAEDTYWSSIWKRWAPFYSASAIATRRSAICVYSGANRTSPFEKPAAAPDGFGR